MPLELDLDAGDLLIQHAQRLLQELLTGLVALQDDNPRRVRHGRLTLLVTAEPR